METEKNQRESERKKPAGMAPLLRLLRPYWKRWILATGALLVGSVINLALPQVVRVTVDDAVATGNISVLKEIAVYAIAGLLLLAVACSVRA